MPEGVALIVSPFVGLEQALMRLFGGADLKGCVVPEGRTVMLRKASSISAPGGLYRPDGGIVKSCGCSKETAFPEAIKQ